MQCEAMDNNVQNEVHSQINKVGNALVKKEIIPFSDKSVTDEVSQILTTLPEAATDFNESQIVKEQWTKISNISELKLNTEDKSDNIGTSHGPCCNENSSPTLSSSSSSESEEDQSEAESSELDEEACAKRRTHCIHEMSTIEKQFVDLREQLFKERYTQITKRLEGVEAETAPEYLQQLQALQQQKQIRLQVASILRDLRISSLHTVLEAEKHANTQHHSNEREMLIGKIQSDLDEKIHRLEEDRDNVDFSNELWTDTLSNDSVISGDTTSNRGKGKKRKEDNVQLFSFGSIKRKKKPVTVTGPYVVYMLRDNDIMDDWAAIKRAVTVSQRRSHFKTGFKKRLCRFEDGKFLFGGKPFLKGQNVVIRSRGERVTFGTIASLNATEVLVQENNGTKSKFYAHDLQRGRYTLHHR
ncbi:breast cancer metastasis-suppressor 1-like protein isoform X1 [Clavelina lepadiformis]|uniref:breast cancer metastasis-suppressor 1-like protein isoform X1 n=1 Tax=Clavelina lepadiformis TaxID=159417 RepID=UPI004041CFF9